MARLVASGDQNVRTSAKICARWVSCFINSIPRPFSTSFSVARIIGSFLPSKSNEELSTASAAVENFLQVQQLFPLPLHQARHGDPRPALNDPCDLLLGDLIAQQAPLLPLLRNLLLRFQLFSQLRGLPCSPS